MKLRNIHIETLLTIGFSIIVGFVLLLGCISYYQTYELFKQTETMYNHPLQVSGANNNLKNEVVNIQVILREMMIAQTPEEKQKYKIDMELSLVNAENQFGVLFDRYLGPKEDIEKSHKSFIAWSMAERENVLVLFAGDYRKVQENLLPSGYLGRLKIEMMKNIDVVDTYAKNKGDEIFSASSRLYVSLKLQLIFLVIVLVLLSSLITYILKQQITRPICEISRAAKHFHSGDMNARSAVSSQNEFGQLSDSFNMLVSDIQETSDLEDKIARFMALMLSKYETRQFFVQVIQSLASFTGSQIAAVYLLSEDKKKYDHYESIGLDNSFKQSFDVDLRDGEFGSVLATRKICRLQDIPLDAKFVFRTVAGVFIPHEIITIPIIINNEIEAIISLGTVKKYTEQAFALIEKILITLSTRIEGILAYKKLSTLTGKLENQNMELEKQKTELASQWAEMMQQNIELETQKAQLDEASRLKTNFLSNMSHELRTPLNSVIALSGVLNRRLADKIPTEEYGYLEVIERNGKNLLTLINDILDISRIEAGKEEVEITRFEVNSLVSDVIEMIYPQAMQKNIDLFLVPQEESFYIVSDESKCRHIMQNIIGNAVKFTEQGKVEINISEDFGSIVITVKDTGIGIAGEHLAHIFDEFRQADSSTSRKFGGSGLGLAIAKKHAELLGGKIAVASVSGEGSLFTLTLPLKYSLENFILDSFESTDNSESLFPEARRASPATVLLVEDSEPSIIQIRDFLEETGYRILVALNGKEALDIIEDTIPDAIILDLMMPGIDGFEVLKNLRNADKTANIPVLILTAKQITKEELKNLTRNNVRQLIQKGDVNRSELQIAVDSMILKKESAKPLSDKPVVVVIEDNPENMLTAKALLSDSFEVCEAIDGISGIKLARKYRPELILLDITLPGMDGIETFEIMRKDKDLSKTPIIALTAHAMASDLEKLTARGFEGHLAKPLDRDIFRATINRILYGK